MEDENIDNDHFGGTEKILINDGNLIQYMKDKKYNDDINYKDIGKRKTCENFGEIEQLYEETLL